MGLKWNHYNIMTQRPLFPLKYIEYSVSVRLEYWFDIELGIQPSLSPVQITLC